MTKIDPHELDNLLSTIARLARSAATDGDVVVVDVRRASPQEKTAGVVAVVENEASLRLARF